MNNNEKYIHANTRTSHKRLESMVLYALHYRLRNVLIHSQFPVLVPGADAVYYLDAYLPALKLAIEIDEPHHDRQVERDAEREDNVKEILGCEFWRIKCDQSIYVQVDQLVDHVNKRVAEEKIESWVHQPVRSHFKSGDYSQRHIDELELNGIPDLVDALAAELSSEGNEVSPGSVRGIPNPGNGEMGFLVRRCGMVFAFYARKTGRVNVRVMEIDASVPDTIKNRLVGRQPRNHPQPRFYALPDDVDGYENAQLAKASYYQFIELAESSAYAQ